LVFCIEWAIARRASTEYIWAWIQGYTLVSTSRFRCAIAGVEYVNAVYGRIAFANISVYIIGIVTAIGDLSKEGVKKQGEVSQYRSIGVEVIIKVDEGVVWTKVQGDIWTGAGLGEYVYRSALANGWAWGTIHPCNTY
jgi:hypothetical protein